jgi:hypothetical protein
MANDVACFSRSEFSTVSFYCVHLLTYSLKQDPRLLQEVGDLSVYLIGSLGEG